MHSVLRKDVVSFRLVVSLNDDICLCRWDMAFLSFVEESTCLRFYSARRQSSKRGLYATELSIFLSSLPLRKPFFLQTNEIFLIILSNLYHPISLPLSPPAAPSPCRSSNLTLFIITFVIFNISLFCTRCWRVDAVRSLKYRCRHSRALIFRPNELVVFIA